MAKFGSDNQRNKQEVSTQAPTTPAPAVPNVTQPVESPAASAEILPAPEVTMEFPDAVAKPDEDVPDMPSCKDPLINDHKHRIGNKRRFLMDALSRALGSEMYLLEVDKDWAPNPLGRGPLVAVRYSREFPTIYVLFDKFAMVPPPEMLAYKAKLANEHGYKYLYETPEVVLTHDRLTEFLTMQRHIIHPDAAALNRAQSAQ